MSIFEELNNIDDEASLNNNITLSDAMDGVFMLVVDNAINYNIDNVVNELKKDYVDEEPLAEQLSRRIMEENNHIIIDPSGIKELIEKIKTCNHFEINQRDKNKKFIEDQSLSRSDVVKIIKQLTIEDYSYTLNSTNKYHEGAQLTVFVTNKSFNLPNRTINGIEIYVKIEYTEAGFVCVVSFHEADKHENNPYKS